MSIPQLIPENYKFIKEEDILNDGKMIKLIFIEKNNPLKTYYDKNKDKISKQKAEKYKQKYANDEEFRDKMKLKRKENYIKNKLKKELKER